MGSKHSAPQTAPLLQLTHVSLTLTDGRTVLDRVSLSLHRRRIGLVGKNGSGKTTLLRILAGERLPRQTGSCEGACTLGYLPQASHLPPDISLAAALGIAAQREALQRLADGDADPGLYDVIGDDWDVEARAARALAEVSLSWNDLDRSAATLSGGEWTRVRLAAILLRSPDLLLLDEPSNHLDQSGRAALATFIRQWNKGLLLASHDRELLAGMDEIWELRDGELFTYGGNYALYREQRAVEESAARQRFDAARLDVKRVESQANEARQRQAKRSSRGAKNAPKLGLPQIILGGMKRQAEATSAKLAGTHERCIAEARERLSEERAKQSRDETLKIEVDQVTVPHDKLVFAFDELNVVFPGTGARLWQDALTGEVRGPARIALMGDNGSGKSTLLRLIAGMDAATTCGTVRWGTTQRMYCDQSLAFLNDDASVLENFRQWTPGLTEGERRIRLGRALFPGDAVLTRTGNLSGGERMRLALACVLTGEEPPHLLLLDEPSNHLDLVSLEQLEAALSGYKGAIVVVSHDETFLAAVGVTQVWRLTSKGLRLS